MSTTYSYVKLVKNIGLLMSTIKNIFQDKIENYDYDVITGGLDITFVQTITVEEKIALDVLINLFVDTAVLSATDVMAYKYIRGYKTLPQQLSNILNSVNEVLFQSASHIDRWYYQMSYNNKFIFIQKPGTYLVFVRVGANLAPLALPGTTTVLQWAVSTDDAKTELAYLPVINSNVYTCHTNVNDMADSTMLCCFVTVNSINGTNIRLTAKPVLGNTLLVVDNDQTSISIMSLPGVAFYEGNMTAALTMNTTTVSNVNLNTDRIVQYPFTHTTGQPGVTISQPGFVIIVGKGTVNKTTGTDTSLANIFLRHNGTNIGNSNSYSHAIAAANNKTTIHCVVARNVIAGDVITLHGQSISGTNLQLTAAETGLLIIYANPQVLPGLTLGSFSNETLQQTSLSSVPVDLKFPVTNLFSPVTAASSDYNTNVYYNITTSGLYFVMANITLMNMSGLVREAGLYLSTSVDGGKNYYYMMGSLGMKQIHGNGRTTVTSGLLVNLTENSKIKITMATSGTTSDNVQVADKTNITLVNFNFYEGVKSVLTPFDSFGMITSPEDMAVNTVSFAERCRLVMHDISSGIYRISTVVGIVTTALMTAIDIQVIDVNSSLGTTYVVYTKSINYPAGSWFFNSVDYMNVVKGSHVYILQISSPNSLQFVTRYGSLEAELVN